MADINTEKQEDDEAAEEPRRTTGEHVSGDDEFNGDLDKVR